MPRRLSSGEAEIQRGVCEELKECRRPAGEEVREAGPAAQRRGEEERGGERSRAEPAAAAAPLCYEKEETRGLQGGVVPADAAERGLGGRWVTARPCAVPPAAVDVPGSAPQPQPACPPWVERSSLSSRDLLSFLVQAEEELAGK